MAADRWLQHWLAEMTQVTGQGQGAADPAQMQVLTPSPPKNSDAAALVLGIAYVEVAEVGRTRKATSFAGAARRLDRYWSTVRPMTADE